MTRGVKIDGCSVEGCEGDHFGKGYCNLHYNRMRRSGTTDLVLTRKTRLCEIDGCDRKHFSSGCCEMHYRRMARTGVPGPPEKMRDFVLGVITSYSAAHAKLIRDRGPASQFPCIDCGEQAEEWSYRYNEPGEFAWSTDPDDYDPRCRSCHRKFDKEK
jgi:hypothetical protein